MITYTTRHGTTHHFASYDIDVQWNALPGVYMFVKPNANGTHDIAYAGQCKRFSDRIPHHDKQLACALLGATTVHAVVVHDSRERDSLEADIISRYNPPLNTQLRTSAPSGVPNLLDFLGDIPRPNPGAGSVEDCLRRPTPSALGTLPQLQGLRRRTTS
jgi:hypothetical protein